ncbi:PREDICTED: uncharacterized protein LOC109207811 [Nicotiana attenuata]|uniref:uncharacterized protein LOC109207811 n=1 Tax=Nicotiana attenuata TaxID=49451 RepID=UPI0009050371|nr:PREDICTED: uncharacterized protein LOC109207811 [Nicotiana attenuata]
MTTMRALIATTVKKQWQTFQLDVNNAFLHGDIHEEVYMHVPLRLENDNPCLVCKLNKSLYGLVNLLRPVHMRCISCGPESLSGSSRQTEHSTIHITVYVDDVIITGTDDVIITGTDLSEIAQLKHFLHDQFKTKDLGRPHYFLGLKVLYIADCVIISQRKFALDILKEYDCLPYSSLSTSLDPNEKLRANEGAPLSNPTYYRRLVGKLNFLTNTRLDIAFSVQYLSQIMQDPRESHLKAAFHLLRYLKNDPTLWIFLSNESACSLKGYCDSDWAACPDSRRSVTGYIVLLGNSPICWKSKKQETVSLSSAKAKYMSLRKQVSVFCDSQSALHIARNPVFHERTIDIEADCHFVRDKLHEGLISLHHIATGAQLAYVLTKALTGVKHYALLSKLAVKPSPQT